MFKYSGAFSLVELIVAMAILGLLLAMATPGYVHQLNKGRRTDGHQLLLKMAAKQELYFMQHHTFTDSISSPEGLNISDLSEQGHYRVSVEMCEARALSECFELVASARGLQKQNDLPCAKLFLTSAGEKYALNSDNAISSGRGVEGRCWG